MISEQKISFKTAKLLAELKIPVFERTMGYSTCFYEPKTRTVRRLGRTGRNPISKLYYAPSQSLLQKHLIEKYNIIVLVDVFNIGFLERGKFCYLTRVFPNSENWFTTKEEYKTYSCALEDGLYLALEFLQNMKNEKQYKGG